MNGEHIIIVDDEEPICNAIAQKLDNSYGDRYIISKFLDAQEALDFIDEFVDPEEDILTMVVSDQKMNRMQGDEFLGYVTKSHPRSIRILNTAYTEFDPVKNVANMGITGVVNKQSKEIQGDELFNIVDRELKRYDNEDKLLRCKIRDITFSQVDTLFWKKEFFKLRYEVYLNEGYKTLKIFRDEENELKMEWDKYDAGRNESMNLTNKIRYLIATDNGRCIGGLRIIDGDCPMEEGHYVEDGMGFKKGQRLNLDDLAERYPDQEIYKREISRLIIHPEFQKRKDGKVLFGLFRFIEQITKNQDTMMCTATPNTIGLYEAFGFERIGPDIEYSLAGRWTPLIRFAWKAHNEPEKIPNIDTKLHRICTRPLPVTDVESWSKYSEMLKEKAIKTGYYIGD